jgi:hypothetical protein
MRQNAGFSGVGNSGKQPTAPGRPTPQELRKAVAAERRAVQSAGKFVAGNRDERTPGDFTRSRNGISPRLNCKCKTARCRRSRWSLSFLIAASRASDCWLACRGTCRYFWGRVTRKSLYSSHFCNCGPTPLRKLLRRNCRTGVVVILRGDNYSGGERISGSRSDMPLREHCPI